MASPSLSNSTKATKAIGGIREEEQRGEHKILQDLDLVDSTHKERDLIGQDVDLDLLSLFPQMGARIMEGLRDRASFSSSTMEERESERSHNPRRKKGGIYTPQENRAVGEKQGPDNPV